MTLIALVVWLLILGFIAWVVNQSPITDPTFKQFIVWALIVIGAILLISFVVHSVGIAPVNGLI